MVVLVLEASGSCVTGIFATRADAESYLEEVPPEQRAQLVARADRDLDLPCFLIENRSGIRAVDRRVLEETLRAWSAERADDDLAGNVYWIRKAWRPPEAGMDYMVNCPTRTSNDSSSSTSPKAG